MSILDFERKAKGTFKRMLIAAGIVFAFGFLLIFAIEGWLQCAR